MHFLNSFMKRDLFSVVMILDIRFQSVAPLCFTEHSPYVAVMTKGPISKIDFFLLANISKKDLIFHIA